MNNNLYIIRGGYSYCSCTSGESQITPAVLQMNIHKDQAALRVSLEFPHWLGDSPRCSQTFHKRSHGVPLPVIRDPSYSEGQPEYPSKVWYSPEIDASKFTLHIVSDAPGGSQRLKSILLMYRRKLSHLEILYLLSNSTIPPICYTWLFYTFNSRESMTWYIGMCILGYCYGGA